MKPNCTPDGRAARATLEAALGRAATRPAVSMHRDNGSSFMTGFFQDLPAAGGIADAPIPTGQPGLNGSLESGNSSLKAAVKTAAMRQTPDEHLRFRRAHGPIEPAAELIQDSCDRVLSKLNDVIARPQFGMPPARAIEGQIDATRARHERFAGRRKAERRDRLAKLPAQPDRPPGPNSFQEAVNRAFARRLRDLSTDPRQCPQRGHPPPLRPSGSLNPCRHVSPEICYGLA